MPQLKENPRKGSMDSWIANAKKEICKCCRKELGLFVGNIAMFRGKCQACRQKICSTCVVSTLCHKCRVKRYVKLTPTDLMQLSGKKLTEIAATLHFHNPQGYEKSELVQLILAIYGMKWTRPIPPPPTSTNQPGAEGESFGKCRLCDKELTVFDPSDTLCVRCAEARGDSYDPDDLMQLSAKGLQDILASLCVPESEVNGREKGELVMLILKTIGRHHNWRPPIPQQPSTRPRSLEADIPATIVIPPQYSLPLSDPVPSRSNSGPGVASSSVNTQNLDNLIDWETVAADNRASTGEPSRDQNDAPEEHNENERPPLSRVSSLRDIPCAEVIQDLKITQLKSLLQKYLVDIEGCCEKKDLADQVTLLYTNRLQAGGGNEAAHSASILSNQRQTDLPSGASQPGESSSAPASGNGSGGEGSSDSKSSLFRRGANSNIVLPEEIPSLRGIPSIEAIGMLSNRQLKMVLHKHKVEYTKCRERSELLQRVTELWKDVTKWTSSEAIPDEDVCKICMDAPIDCVFLDCGHMAACTECGRQMPECPICRQFVVRVVHIFKV